MGIMRLMVVNSKEDEVWKNPAEYLQNIFSGLDNWHGADEW